jgi:hypothetical protein
VGETPRGVCEQVVACLDDAVELTEDLEGDQTEELRPGSPIHLITPIDP